MKKLALIIVTIVIVAFSQSCAKDPIAATVSTKEATGVQYQTATLNGSVDDAGGGTISERGFIYSNVNDLDPANIGVVKVKVGTGEGAFTIGVSQLSPATTYYFKAYAVNEFGTSYGTVLTFTTL